MLRTISVLQESSERLADPSGQNDALKFVCGEIGLCVFMLEINPLTSGEPNRGFLNRRTPGAVCALVNRLAKIRASGEFCAAAACAKGAPEVAGALSAGCALDLADAVRAADADFSQASSVFTIEETGAACA